MKLEVKKENINPNHYKSGKIEVIDVIEDQLTEEEYLGFIKGLVMKYVMRSNMKNGLEDLEKAKWYLERLSKYYKDRLEMEGDE